MTFVTRGSVTGTRSRTTARIRAETAISQCPESAAKASAGGISAVASRGATAYCFIREFSKKRSPAEPSAQSGTSAASGSAPRHQ